MKIFSICHSLMIYLGLSIFSTMNAMNTRPLVIVLDGPTCSGKTSLSRSFMQFVVKKTSK